ncbi:hypothetical protein CVT26_013881 [Gymnopilus dilepis]|uniref:Uncharacterized protein n=1 Tax=Gymnopilus dilepis TaxID=231916 RepID=A0A409Y637_9AGAR|nr:hypothetical protein CVT26_013881 [Gymnopilus dilepis]
MSIPSPSTTSIPNPNVYLNFLPPKTAQQFEVARDLYLGTLGAAIWDILVSLPEDLVLIRGGFRPALVAYFTSRIFSLAYVLLSVVSKTHKVAHCTALEYGVTISWVITSAASASLFFQRVKAVYSGQKSVHYLFAILLLVNVGTSFVVPLGSKLGPLANTGYCTNKGLKRYTAAAPMMRLIYDSLVFLAISFKIATMRGVSGEVVTLRTLFSRKSSSRLVRALLRGGQQYYLYAPPIILNFGTDDSFRISVCSNLLVAVLIVVPSAPPIYQAMFTVPDIALSSSMACRVFRNLKITADRIDTAMSGVMFRKTAPPGFAETSRGTESIVTRLQSDASTLRLPPPGTRSRLASASAPSLHNKEGRYSIIKVKPVASQTNTRPFPSIEAIPSVPSEQNDPSPGK